MIVQIMYHVAMATLFVVDSNAKMMASISISNHCKGNDSKRALGQVVRRCLRWNESKDMCKAAFFSIAAAAALAEKVADAPAILGEFLSEFLRLA